MQNTKLSRIDKVTKKMVYLKSYECHSCHNLCKYYVNKGYPTHVGICVECGYLICGKCRVSEERKRKCEVTGKQCEFISYYTAYFNYLKQYAPDDELKLLNFGKWSPIISNSCCEHSITPNNKLAFIDSIKTFCAKCKPNDKIPKQPPVDTYMEIINEVRGYFSEEKDHFVLRKGIQLKSMKCTICKKNSNPIRLSETAVLHCKNCMENFDNSFLVGWPGCCGTLGYLLNYIPCIKDLKLLTYSKWTPLRCEECTVMFSEAHNQLPMFHADCGKIICENCSWKHKCSDEEAKFSIVSARFLVDVLIEFRSLFKNDGFEEALTAGKTTQQGNMFVKKEASLESMYIRAKQEIRVGENLVHSQFGGSCAFLPRSISCQSCSRRADVTEARNCINCAIHGICSVCIINEHWGHNILKTEEGMLREVLQDDAKSTLEKLTKWKGRLTDIHTQGLTVQQELCDSYKCVYEKAMRLRDPELVQAIRQENVNQMQKRVKDFIALHIKLNEEARALAERLRDLNKDT